MENANAGIGSDTLVRREAGLEQNLKMFARLRWGRFGRRGEFTRAVRPFAEEFDHPSPSRIGKCDEGLIDGGGKFMSMMLASRNSFFKWKLFSEP